MDIQLIKLELIKAIAEMKDDTLLIALKRAYHTLLPVTDYKTVEETDSLSVAREPVPEKLNLSQLKQTQNYNSTKLDTFFSELDRSIWQDEKVDELLQIL